jgi:UDP-N-acetylglucosamine diphosphorylase/glucosamine-1-phosphate N-acetyltransferase
MPTLATVVLAAGKGKRMRSDLPKVLHTLAGRPLVEYLLDALVPLRPSRTVVVVGYQADRVKSCLVNRDVIFAEQTEQLGTGHAVMQAREALDGFTGTILVLVGDAPLLSTRTLERFLAQHAESGAACTLMTTRLDDPDQYGRIVRNAASDVQAIVEHRDATPEERRIREINSGIIAFESGPLWDHIGRLSRTNAQAEYYLTDLVGIFGSRGLKVGAFCVENEWEVLGINSQEQLQDLERIYIDRARSRGGGPV